MEIIMILARVLAFGVGLLIVAATFRSALRSFVLPRSAQDWLTNIVFQLVNSGFRLRLRQARSYEQRDQILALLAPIALLSVPVAWLALVLVGYMGMFWALGVDSWWDTFKISGSSLLTLGFATAGDLPTTLLVFSEAAGGLILVALLIAYLPTIYSAFARREAAVTLLEARAGSPPSAVTLITRYHRIGGLDRLPALWESWEIWFADVEESHTSLPAVVFFRSPQSHRSWVTAAGAVLDGAALVNAVVDIPHEVQADLCLRAGFLALRRIADFFGVAYNPRPAPSDPISLARSEFDAACAELAGAGVPLKADLDQAWRDFAGWRVNYDPTLLALASITSAPYAPWSSDRCLRQRWNARRQRKAA